MKPEGISHALRKAAEARRPGLAAVLFLSLIIGCAQQESDNSALQPPTPAAGAAVPSEREPARHKEPRALYEESGGFSYDPPAGWKIVRSESLEFRSAVGPAAAFYPPNIIIYRESWAAPLEAYADASIAAIQAKIADLKTISRDQFRTDDGEHAVRIVTERMAGDVRIRQTFYFFRGVAQARYVATCSCRADESTEFEADFDTSMRSFRIH